MEIDAPGGLQYERDGIISARGTAERQLLASLDGCEIRADLLRYNQRDQTGQAKGAASIVNRAAGRVRQVQAETVDFSMASRTVHAEGNVRLAEEAMEIQADTADADLAEGDFEIKGAPVFVRSGSQSFRAGRIIYDESSSLLTARGRVDWSSRTNGQEILVTAGSLDYNLAERKGWAADGVKAARGDLLCTGNQLTYEESADRFSLSGEPALMRGDLRLTATAISWQPGLGLAVASGGANITSGPFSGTADEIRYDSSGNQAEVRLIGAARIAKGRSVLTGHEILWDVTTGTVQVIGQAKATIDREEQESR